MKFKLLILFYVLLTLPLSTSADSPKADPPSKNPHPPVTEIDKKRVELAELAITTLLKKKVQGPFENRIKDTNGDQFFFGITKECLQNPKCYNSNTELQRYIFSLQRKFGVLRNSIHAHIIPWSLRKFNKYQYPNKKIAPQSSKPYIKSKRIRKNRTVSSSESVAKMRTPNLQKNEYMVHSYVLFDKSGAWYHLDTIISEDKNGNMKVERFFIIKIPSYNTKLPPGVVC